MSTIYESIGKSVTVPHYGSKTIQVRLTVVPENGKSRSQRERREAQRRRRKDVPMSVNVTQPDCAPHSDDDQRDRLSPDDDLSSKSSCSGEHRTTVPDRRPTAVIHPRHHRHPPPRREHRERKHTKKRSGSLQRRELLEIIQANMEKNHLSFQASRLVFFTYASFIFDAVLKIKHRITPFNITGSPANLLAMMTTTTNIRKYGRDRILLARNQRMHSKKRQRTQTATVIWIWPAAATLTCVDTIVICMQ